MRIAKFIVAALATVAVALQSAITDGAITRAEWVAVGVAALGAVGVYLVPNKPEAGSQSVSGRL